eukprot:975334_1
MASALTFAQPPNEPQYKLHIAIDFGTDGLGLAYAIGDEVYVHSKWNSERHTDVVKPKTIILLDRNGEADAFGSDAKEIYMKLKSKKDNMLFERFKMALYDNTHHPIQKKRNDDEKSANHYDGIDIRSKLTADNGREYPAGLVFIAAFKYIQTEARRFVRKKKIKAKNADIQWILTVPAIWSDKAKYMMRQWIIKAGLVDANDKSQCKIVYEPDCASLAIQHQLRNAQNNDNDDHKKGDINDASLFCKGEKYILIDAGGGTVDVACHEIVVEFGVKEVLPPSGGPWGSCKIDDQYEQTLNQIFGEELMHEFKTKHPNIYMRAIDHFQNAKATFDGSKKHHNCRLPSDFILWLDEKIEDNDDVEDVEDLVANCVMAKSNLVELDDEVLTFHRYIWISMFDQIIDPIQEHIEELLCNPSMMRNCKYLCLVGGLSCSPYFQHKMKTVFGERSRYKLRVIIPERPMLCVVYGAACFGITKNYIKARRVTKTYGVSHSCSVAEALKEGVSQAYIDSRKHWRPHFKEYEVPLFFPVIYQGTEVWTNQVMKTKFCRAGAFDRLRVNVLVSNEMNPTEWSSKDVLVRSTMDFQPSDPIGASVIVEWHLYDTTIKVIYYLTIRPNDKTELEITYEST